MKTFFFIFLFSSFACEDEKNPTEELTANLSLIETSEENPIRSGQSFHLLIVQDTEELANEFLENSKEDALSLTQKGVKISQHHLSEKILPQILRVNLGVNKQTLTESAIADSFTLENHLEFSDKKTADDFLQLLEEKSSPLIHGVVLEHNKKFFLITKERKKLFEINPLQDIQFVVEKKGLSLEFIEELKEMSKKRDTLILVNKKNISPLQKIPERKFFMLENFAESNQNLILIKSTEKKRNTKNLFCNKRRLSKHTQSFSIRKRKISHLLRRYD